MKKTILFMLLAVFSLTFSGCCTISEVPSKTLQEQSFINSLVVKNPKVVIFCEGEAIGQGTGVLLGSSDGRVYLTSAAHVLRYLTLPGCSGSIKDEGKIRALKVEYTSPKDDVGLASYECFGCAGNKYTKIAKKHYVGQPIITVGYQGFHTPSLVGTKYGVSVSNGVIATSVYEVVEDTKVLRLLRITAQVNKGNSGGGVFNSYGELVGLVSFGIQGEGQHFIVSYNRVLECLLKKELSLN